MRETGASGRARSRFLSILLLGAALLGGPRTAHAADPTPASLPAEAPASTEERLRQMQQLRQEVKELRRTRPQSVMLAPAAPRQTIPMLPAAVAQNDGNAPGPDAGAPTGSGSSFAEDTADPQAGPPGSEGPETPGSGDNFPFTVSNYLDMWLNYRAYGDKLNVRFGRMVTPFLLERSEKRGQTVRPLT